jgi:hypothetical protein
MNKYGKAEQIAATPLAWSVAARDNPVTPRSST